MRILGLTGGVGMGKSTASKVLSDLGLPLVDTDLLARELVEPGQAALTEIGARFGQGVLTSDGRLRRDELARLVFADGQARRDLEGILHPRIRARWMAEAEEWRSRAKTGGGPQAGVVVIPLLFETHAGGEFDATICVACSEATQRQRLRERGWSDQEINQRIAAQWPIEKKISLATYVLWNEGEMTGLVEQIKHILAAELSSLDKAG